MVVATVLLSVAGAGLAVALFAPGTFGLAGAVLAAAAACGGITTEVARDWWGRP